MLLWQINCGRLTIHTISIDLLCMQTQCVHIFQLYIAVTMACEIQQNINITIYPGTTAAVAVVTPANAIAIAHNSTYYKMIYRKRNMLIY